MLSQHEQSMLFSPSLAVVYILCFLDGILRARRDSRVLPHPITEGLMVSRVLLGHSLPTHAND